MCAEKEIRVCPRCGHFIPRDDCPGEYPGALSRKDNTTEVCSACGIVEASEDFAKVPYVGIPYWNTNVKGAHR